MYSYFRFVLFCVCDGLVVVVLNCLYVGGLFVVCGVGFDFVCLVGFA